MGNMNCFSEVVSNIQNNESGKQLKDLIMKNGIVEDAVKYLDKYTPKHNNFGSDDWKTFTKRKAVPFCLKMLAGVCTDHANTQQVVGNAAIPDLHRIEQISSEEGVGTYAENVLEALRGNDEVALKVKAVRKATRMEKKKKAMAVRQKQLGSLGMHTNEKGQVLSKSKVLKQISELVEETGLTCIICREGYKFEPKKVLGIYTYTRRCCLEDFENKTRKQQGYSTVSHFNVVHYDCHTAAVRMARGREEWDSAMLQNANTKCNGLLPLWGPQVPESAFASCLARHNSYLQEATGQREPGLHSTVHDLKLLLLRFAHDRSFSIETGGGGRQSNIHLIPYIIHAGLYVINTTRIEAREERLIVNFMKATKDKWLSTSYDVDGPLFILALIPFLGGKNKWKEYRSHFLECMIAVGHIRKCHQSPVGKLTNTEVMEYDVYKPYLLFWSLVQLIITVQLKNAPDDAGSKELAEYIRNNDAQLLETGEKVLKKFQDEIVVCESLDEFVDVMELYDITDNTGGTAYVKRILDSLPH